MVVFDKEAKNYDDWYGSKIGRYADKVQTDLALSLFKPSPDMRVLDVGCGTGNFSIKLAEMGCKVIGIDKSENMLNKAREKAKAKDLDIEFYNMNVYNMSFSDEEFDGVCSMAAFEFINNPEDAHTEMLRVLKESSHMLIGTINLESKWGEFYLSEPVQKNTVFKHADFKSMSDMKSWNSDSLIDSSQCLFIPPNTEDKDISMEAEKELSASERGGFICGLWKKQA